MENKSPETPPLKTVSSVETGSLNEANELSAEKIVLYDECGDSLWDDILAQENKISGKLPWQKILEK